jgi:hypothetical protein
MPCLKDGRVALGPTAEEFADAVMAPTIVAAELGLDNLQHEPAHSATTFRNGVQILYSFDNAKIHESAVSRGLLDMYDWKAAKDRLTLPPYSPDMHRVIEHSHGTATYAFRQWLYQNPDKNTLQDYKEGFEMVYKQVNTPAVIRKDVAGLTELYSWVHNNRGEMAPKKMR